MLRTASQKVPLTEVESLSFIYMTFTSRWQYGRTDSLSLNTFPQVLLKGTLSLKWALWARWWDNCKKVSQSCIFLASQTDSVGWHSFNVIIHIERSSSHVLTCKVVCPLVAETCIILCFYANQDHMKFIRWMNLLVQQTLYNHQIQRWGHEQ